MKETKSYFAVHDQDGNIKSFFVTASSAGTRLTMTPGKGYSVSQVNAHDLKIPGEFKIAGQEDANRLRDLRKHYRVDTTIVGSIIKKSTKEK